MSECLIKYQTLDRGKMRRGKEKTTTFESSEKVSRACRNAYANNNPEVYAGNVGNGREQQQKRYLQRHLPVRVSSTTTCV